MPSIDEKKVEELTKKICKTVELMSWKEIKQLGMNIQQAQKIKRGESVRFYGKSLKRLEKVLFPK